MVPPYLALYMYTVSSSTLIVLGDIYIYMRYLCNVYWKTPPRMAYKSGVIFYFVDCQTIFMMLVGVPGMHCARTDRDRDDSVRKCELYV
jgi:hypothetical protein